MYFYIVCNGWSLKLYSQISEISVFFQVCIIQYSLYISGYIVKPIDLILCNVYTEMQEKILRTFFSTEQVTRSRW